MLKVIAVLSADWHISPGAWKHRGVAGDAYCALGQLADLAVARGAALIAAGDLFDSDDPDPLSVSVVTKTLDRLEGAGCPFYYIAGQHEFHRLGHWLGVHRWARHLDRDPPWEVGGARVYGLDWTPPAELPARLAAIPPDVDLLVLHQVWSELMGETLGVHEGSLAEVPGDMTILTGDYHKASAVFQAGAHRVLSPGSICMQSLDEPAEKYCWLLYEDGSLEKHALLARPFRRLTVDSDDALGAALAWVPGLGNYDGAAGLPEEIRRPLLVVEFPDTLTRAPAALKAAVGDGCHLFLRPRRPAAAPGAKAAAGARPGGLVENLGELAKPGSPNYARLRRLLESGRPAEELQALKGEFFA